MNISDLLKEYLHQEKNNVFWLCGGLFDEHTEKGV